MEFIDDYRSKKKLAERLRKRADAMSKVPAFNPIVTTQGNENFPGMQQANIAAPIAQIGQAIFGNIAENRAQEAEDERVEARRAALRGLLGGGAGAPAQGNAPPQFGALGAVGGQMTPEQQAVAGLPRQDGLSQTLPGQLPVGTPPLQVPEQGGIQNGKPTLEQLDALVELGVDPSIIKMYMANDDDKLGAEAQAAQTRQGRAILVLRGKMSQEMKDKLDAEEEAAIERKTAGELTNYEKKQQIEAKYRAPTQGRAQSEMEVWLAQNPGKTVEDYMKLKASLRGGGAGKAAKESPAQVRANMTTILSEMKRVASDPNFPAFGNVIGELAGQAESPVINYLGGLAENSAGKMMSSLQLDAALQEATKLTPVSNADFKNLKARFKAAAGNPKEFIKAVDAYEKFLDKYGDGASAPNQDEYTPVNVDPTTGIRANRGNINTPNLTSPSGVSYTVEED